MSDRREAAARSPGAANDVTPPGPAADRERILLLECRLEQMRAALSAAREEADGARTKLAEACARESTQARRLSLLHEELAQARAEIATLHRHLERSEALRAEIEGHLFEGGPRKDAEELVQLRQKVLAEDQRSLVDHRTLTRLRDRIEELVASRETLLTRVAEWQQLIREDGPEAADLSEFLAELRREILDLEHRDATSDAREKMLRERLTLAGIDPDDGMSEPGEGATEQPSARNASGTPSESSDGPEAHADEQRSPQLARLSRPEPARPRTPGATDSLMADLAAAEAPARRADLLLRLGRSGDKSVSDAIRPWTEAPEASVRAAAYEALGRLLERDPDALEPYLRMGLADTEAHVRRRVVLAAATARGLSPRSLVEPLAEDPDAQVRRVVREVLRQTQSTASTSRVDDGPHAEAVAEPVPTTESESHRDSSPEDEPDPTPSNRSLRTR